MTDARKEHPLGSAQIYVLGMVNPEWPTRHPDARSVRVLRLLEARGLTYENYGRWYISAKGREALQARSTEASANAMNRFVERADRGDPEQALRLLEELDQPLDV